MLILRPRPWIGQGVLIPSPPVIRMLKYGFNLTMMAWLANNCLLAKPHDWLTEPQKPKRVGMLLLKSEAKTTLLLIGHIDLSRDGISSCMNVPLNCKHEINIK